MLVLSLSLGLGIPPTSRSRPWPFSPSSSPLSFLPPPHQTNLISLDPTYLRPPLAPSTSQVQAESPLATHGSHSLSSPTLALVRQATNLDPANPPSTNLSPSSVVPYRGLSNPPANLSHPLIRSTALTRPIPLALGATAPLLPGLISLSSPRASCRPSRTPPTSSRPSRPPSTASPRARSACLRRRARPARSRLQRAASASTRPRSARATMRSSASGARPSTAASSCVPLPHPSSSAQHVS